MEQNILEYIGKSLYQTDKLKEMKRYVVFRTRCKLHSKEVNDILSFFDDGGERYSWLKGTPSLMEQTTRSFFYKDSTWDERVNIVKNHLTIMEGKFNMKLMHELYADCKFIKLWEEIYNDKPLELFLRFHPGRRKEGSLSLLMLYEGIELYQIMFWFGKEMDGDKPAIYIGAIQGAENAGDLIKGLTKAFFGYRTKNLIFYSLRCIAKQMGIEKIYAVSNDGYYAMNHVRMDRKLKTDFGAFWAECEGVPASDRRFYVMPVEEHRKSMEELKPSKRAQHRRRFAKMDEMEAAIADSLAKYKK